jgi:integrase
VRLQICNRIADRALLDLAIDIKLRACDLVKLRVRDVSHGERLAMRAIVMQQKTQRPVQFEIPEQTRDSVFAWIRPAALRSEHLLFPSRVHQSPSPLHDSATRIVDSWVREIGLDPAAYGAHSLRRTKPLDQPERKREFDQRIAAAGLDPTARIEEIPVEGSEYGTVYESENR